MELMRKVRTELELRVDTPLEEVSAPRSARMTEWVLPPHTNAYGTAFGGVILSWMDIAGVAAGQRYARSKVVTLAIEQMQFTHPIRLGALVTIEAEVIYVGKTSLEVEVTVLSEDTVLGRILEAAHAFFSYVAIGPDGNPSPLKPLVTRNEEERQKFDLAVERRASRRKWKR